MHIFIKEKNKFCRFVLGTACIMYRVLTSKCLTPEFSEYGELRPIETYRGRQLMKLKLLHFLLLPVQRNEPLELLNSQGCCLKLLQYILAFGFLVNSISKKVNKAYFIL